MIQHGLRDCGHNGVRSSGTPQRPAKPIAIVRYFQAITTCALALGWTACAQAKTAEISAGQVCSSSNRHFVAPCFNVHARLELGADNIAVWIWPVGTHRYLGFLGYVDQNRVREECDLPTVLTSPLMAGKTIFANITVRPISREQPGHMQFVCIAAAKHLVVVDHRP